MKRPLVITTGDADGIGPEVVSNALLKIRKLDRPFIITSQVALPSWRKLKKKYSIEVVDKWMDIVHSSKNNYLLLNPQSTPQDFVYAAALGCHENLFSAMATGPMSKSKKMGHTEILKEVSGAKNLFMAFVGAQFSTVSSTGHIPLKEVSNKLSLSLLKIALARSYELAKKINCKKPIALLGLNPHAGEFGLIGKEEIRLLKPLLKWAKSSRIPVVGPLPPDTAFTTEMQSQFSVYLGLYHDQVLIPFKAVHGFKDGVHLTLGLDFVRTSVDHGTAKDIVGKNKAHHESMLKAIELACRLS